MKDQDINGEVFSLSENFEKIFREYFTLLTYYALKFTKDNDSARDIVQQVFLKIWENRENIDLDIPVRSYLYSSVHNRCLNWLRDKARFHPDDTSDIEFITELSHTDNDRLEEIELESRINGVINRLPERCSEVFRLNRFKGKKYAEIAQILNISVKTVEAQVSKALRILREELKDYLIFVIVLFILNFYRVSLF